jgi:hypothetical protein
MAWFRAYGYTDWFENLSGRLSDVQTRLRRIEALVQAGIKSQEKNAMAFIDDLELAVSSQTTVNDSIVALLDQIAAALAAAGVDPVRSAAVLSALQTEQTKIADAVVRNTPAAV